MTAKNGKAQYTGKSGFRSNVKTYTFEYIP